MLERHNRLISIRTDSWELVALHKLSIISSCLGLISRVLIALDKYILLASSALNEGVIIDRSGRSVTDFNIFYFDLVDGGELIGRLVVLAGGGECTDRTSSILSEILF